MSKTRRRKRRSEPPASCYHLAKEPSVRAPNEPTNLVLEQLRLMRGETNARFDEIATSFKEVRAEISGVKTELRGLKLNTIAEVYKANLTVASFADHERRIQALERQSV